MTLALLNRLLVDAPDMFWRLVLLPLDVTTLGRYSFTAAGALIVRDSQVLMIERRKSGQRCFPGGLQRLWEPLPNTAIREVEEETGYLIRIASCLGTYPGQDPRWRVTLTLYQSEIVGGHERGSEEGQPVWRPWRDCLRGLAFNQGEIVADLVTRGILN